MPKSNAPMVRYVQHYNATYGWYLFPARVVRGVKKSWMEKKTAPGGLNWGMSADPRQLEKNFTHYHRSGIGLPTGEVNSLFVVEIDTKEGHDADGLASLKMLEQRHGKLPKTMMARSPSGSLHFYFNHPGYKIWSSASKLAPGVDVRGDGGMVIAPPSKRDDGVYEWYGDDVDIADAPEWLLAIVAFSAAEAPQLYAAALGNGADPDDPYHIAASDAPKPPVDVDAWLDEMQFGVNVHETEVVVSASLLNHGMPVDEVVEYLVREVFERIPEAKKWNRNVEIENVRRCCVDCFRKWDDVLELQETIPPWLAKKLNGHAPIHDEAPEEVQETEAPKPAMPWPEMGKDALYGLTGEVVRLIEPHTEADPNAILIQFLAYFGNAAGRDHYYPVERTRHHANLFVVLVGDTSKARKGTSADWLRDHMNGVPEWSKCIKGGLSSGEGAINDIKDDAEKIDAQGNIVLGMARDKRRLFDEREFSRVLTVMKRETSTLSHILREAWDGRSISVLVKNNPLRCTNPHISICGHITSDELRRDLDSTSMANGYANRFLFGCVKRSKELPFGSDIAQSDLDAMAQKITKRVELTWMIEKAIVMDQKARELWANAYSDLSAAKDGLVGAITARAEAQTIRLALIYAMLDGSDEIKLVHLKAGLAVWRYCEDSARYIFGKGLGDGVADQALEYLRDASKVGMSRTDLHVMFGRNVSASNLTRALMLLKRYGLAISTKKVGKGRPLETWYCT